MIFSKAESSWWSSAGNSEQAKHAKLLKLYEAVKTGKDQYDAKQTGWICKESDTNS